MFLCFAVLLRSCFCLAIFALHLLRFCLAYFFLLVDIYCLRFGTCCFRYMITFFLAFSIIIINAVSSVAKESTVFTGFTVFLIACALQS